MQALTDELRIASGADSDVRRFIGEIKKFAFIMELDEAILNRLIDKIYISAVEVIDREKVQKVRIIYSFVGEVKQNNEKELFQNNETMVERQPCP